jgi:hypothetical protein
MEGLGHQREAFYVAVSRMRAFGRGTCRICESNPSWRHQGVINYRLGHHDLAIERFHEAEQIAVRSGSDNLDFERRLTAIYLPIALHGLGRDYETKQIFKEKQAEANPWREGLQVPNSVDDLAVLKLDKVFFLTADGSSAPFTRLRPGVKKL